MCLHIAELTNKNTGSSSSSQYGYRQDDMYTIQLKRKKLPTPTHGGLSLYLKGEPNQNNNENNLHRAVEIEKYPRTRYSRCWLFCIMYICTSDEPAHVHLFSSSFP